MHEQIIAQRIIDEANSHGNIEKITVEVGDLAHLPADEIKIILEKLTNWKVDVKKKKAIISCVCGFEGEPKILQHLHDNVLYECPKCKNTLPTILDGSDIILKEVEVEE